MIRKNNHPEDMENSPEFLMVTFDENGQPVKAKPIKDPSAYNEGSGLKNTEIYSSSRPIPVTSVDDREVVRVDNREAIKKLLIFFLRNTESLRQEIRQSNTYFQQVLQDIKPTDQTPLLETKINNLGKWASLQNEYNQAIKKKLDALAVYFDGLSEKMNQFNFNPLVEKLDDVNLKISNLTEEIAGTKAHEMETIESIKSLSKKISALGQEIENQRSVESAFGEKFNMIEDELIRINDSILQNNLQDQQIASKIEKKLSETTSSINELYENQKQMKEELLINQEKVSKNIVNDVISKVQNMLKKPKKRQKKPQRAKVIRFLRKNFEIQPFTKVLIITDKRNSIFGNILHESVRKINEKSILLITENRTNETLLDKPVVEAIKISDHVFIIGKHSLTEIKEISEKLRNKVKIISIKRSLKYSIL